MPSVHRGPWDDLFFDATLPPMKSLDDKLAHIHADPSGRRSRFHSRGRQGRRHGGGTATDRRERQRGAAVFLKLPYHGPLVMAELTAYDPHRVVGVLGGSAGTSYDASLHRQEARQHGARAALFGRKINASEHQLTFVRYLRSIADGGLDAADAVGAYHADLARRRIKPRLEPSDDLNLTETQHHA